MTMINREMPQEALKERSDIDPYHLPEGAFAKLQSELVSQVDSISDQQTVHAVWIRSDSPFANLARTLESEQFPEIADVMEPFEDQSVFLAMVDNRPDAQRVVHTFRLTSLGLADMEIPEGDTTGVALLDDIAGSGQGVTATEIKRYYEGVGLDLTKCVSVETNLRVGEKITVDSELPVSQLGYLAIFRALKSLGAEEDSAAVFAHLNDPAIKSLGAVGVTWESIAGKPGLKTPTVHDGIKGFDDKYSPVAIPTSKGNMSVFGDLEPFAAPEIRL